MDLNRVTFLGYVSKAPERKTAGKQTLTKFHLATNYTWKEPKTGEVKEKADFHSIVAWGKLGQTIQQYVHKGDHLFLEGRLSNHHYEDQAGVTHYYTDIVANTMSMLTPKKATEDTEEIRMEEIPEVV